MYSSCTLHFQHNHLVCQLIKYCIKNNDYSIITCSKLGSHDYSHRHTDTDTDFLYFHRVFKVNKYYYTTPGFYTFPIAFPNPFPELSNCPWSSMHAGAQMHGRYLFYHSSLFNEADCDWLWLTLTDSVSVTVTSIRGELI